MKNIIDSIPFCEFKSKDNNFRYINIYRKYNLMICNDTFYPNVLFTCIDNDEIYIPYKEKIMSLQFEDSYEIKKDKNLILKKYYNPLFFFIYNTDNYYHFVYDTLPYLISFFELKKMIPELKLLMNYPNSQKNDFYRFVEEFLDILGIKKSDIVIIDKNTLYSEIYFSNSYTHDFDSNLPPREEIYDFYKYIVNVIKEKNIINTNFLPKKIYISRRTWLHGDTSNIGTNYTNRRKLESEDKLVEYLISEGFTEIFTEKLSTIEKILLFDNAEIVVGAIGGGLCNVLFSNSNCKLIPICSPTFLEINNRFIYSFNNVKTYYFNETFHTENNFWKKWMRVKSNNIIGEIEEVEDELLSILYVDDKVAGWNSEMQYKKIKLHKNECTPLDKGLNSSWDLDLDSFKKFYKII